MLWIFVVAAMAADRPPQAQNRAAWMARGTFGVMTHYLVTPNGNTPAEKTADLNRTVDHFDLDGYIRQFQETGADWLIFTLGKRLATCVAPTPILMRKPPATRRAAICRWKSPGG